VGRLIVYSDLGSPHADRIARINGGRNLVVIVDHHDPQATDDPHVVNVNPERFGYSGERDASASTVAYLLAEALSRDNRDLSCLGVVGSAEIPDGFHGLNLHCLERAVEMRLAEVVGGEREADVRILAFEGSPSYRRASTLLSVLGSVGYYRDGPSKAVSACLGGFPKAVQRLALEYEEERRRANRRVLGKIRREGLAQSRFAQWFHAEDMYAGMSGKVLGSFCSYLRYQRGVNPTKYLIGFMHIGRSIPGFGELARDYTKVSARAPDLLGRMIGAGKRPALSELVARVCASLGGFGDGHSVAASGILPRGSERDFIEEFDRAVEEGLQHSPP
jgi:single-stranded-DNA-specific exonuclease